MTRRQWVWMGLYEIKCEATPRGLLDHPIKGNIGQPSLWVASTDIGMHAHKPRLLHNLFRGMGLVPEKGYFKIRAMFIDGHGLESVFHRGTQIRIVELIGWTEVPVKEGVP